MNLTVYSISGAPSPWRVFLGLTFKGLDYHIEYLEGFKKEHKQEPFLTLNPRGTVPVLVVNGTAGESKDSVSLRDSIAILAWLDREFPSSPLFGSNAKAAASIWQQTMDACDHLRPAAHAVLFPTSVLKEPLPVEGTEKRAQFDAAAATLHRECQSLEDALGDQAYFGNQCPSAADAVIFPEIRLIDRALDLNFELMQAIGFAEFSTLYPQINAWKERISAMDGIEKTLPRHWQNS